MMLDTLIDTIDQFVNRLSLNAAAKILIILPAAFLVFHGFIIAGVLPHNIAWGGRLTDATMLPFELFAIALNLLLMILGGVAARFITSKRVISAIEFLKWGLFYFVVVNTVAALFSTTSLEVAMTPITALYAVCIYRIAKFPDGLGR